MPGEINVDQQFGGDLHALWQYLKQIEAENRELVVKAEPKPAIAVNRKVS